MQRERPQRWRKIFLMWVEAILRVLKEVALGQLSARPYHAAGDSQGANLNFARASGRGSAR